MEKMTKKDLQNGDWVELRDGDRYLVMLNCERRNGEIVNFCLLKGGGVNYNISPNYLDNLKNITYDEFDIMKVWRNPNGVNGETLKGTFIGNGTLIWDYKEIEGIEKTKEMTLKEVCKELGYNVKIVKE